MPSINGRFYMNPFYGRALERARALEEGRPWPEEEDQFGSPIISIPNGNSSEEHLDPLSSEQNNYDEQYGGRAPHRLSGSEPLYASARGKTTYIIYKDGTLEKRTGTRAWRNNNPGDIEYHPGIMREGQIGHDSRFIIFGDSRHGFDALSMLLSGKSYSSLTVDEAVARFAPPNENDTRHYQKFVHAAGVPGDARIESLSARQKRALMKAIAKIEGFDKPGADEFPEFP